MLPQLKLSLPSPHAKSTAVWSEQCSMNNHDAAIVYSVRIISITALNLPPPPPSSPLRGDLQLRRHLLTCRLSFSDLGSGTGLTKYLKKILFNARKNSNQTTYQLHHNTNNYQVSTSTEQDGQYITVTFNKSVV